MMFSVMLSSDPANPSTGWPLILTILSPGRIPALAAGLFSRTSPTICVGMKSFGFPTPHTTTAESSASSMENSGPAKATMILSSGVMGGSGLPSLLPPSSASIGAICGSATKPPAGIQPRPYCTPLTSFFQIGVPNQIWNRSIRKPRHLAARKWPSSWTKMMMLKIVRTTAINRMTCRMVKMTDMGEVRTLEA